MKHICNMTVPEAKQAFDKWIEKHQCPDDKFQMGGLQLTRYAELLGRANREELLTLICDIFNHGFMAGYKQPEVDLKVKIDKRVKDESHHKILELVYYLPFGYRAEYFYCMMSYLLPEDCFYLIPNRITKPILAIQAEREDRKATELEYKQTEEEKRVGQYRCDITRIIYNIESVDILMKIYTCAKTHLAILQEKGGAV